MDGALCEPLATGSWLAICTRTGGGEVAVSPPPVALRLQTCSELWTGTIGARREWTASMISVLSMPWR
jgi:hypothetical protein